MEKILYIEAIDINSLYGSGGGPMVRYSNKISPQFIYITFTSANEKLGFLHVKKIDNRDFNYIPICRTISNKYARKIVPLNIYFLLNLFFKMKVIRELEIKNIITKTYTVLWLFALLKKGYDICYIFPGLENPLQIGRFPQFARLLQPIYDFISILAFRRTNAMFVAASDRIINEKNLKLRENNVTKAIIKIPQAVDTSMFKGKDKGESKKNISVSERYVFTFLGRLAVVKGVDFLIGTFQIFSTKYPDSKFIIIGDGEERDKISRIICEKNLSDKIIMVGRKSPPELIDYICASDAGIFASHKEGFSNAMLEFLSCGIPIISTDVGGVDELVIKNKTGYVVRNRDSSTYISLMEEVINEDLKYSCLEHVKNNFTLNSQWKIIADNWPALKVDQDFGDDA